MLRLSIASTIFAATVLAAGCPSKQPPVRATPAVASDAALRIRIAHAEARRADGVDELIELATSKDVHARELALRGLGRTGGAKALAALDAAVADPDLRVVAAALAGIGLAGSLDDKLAWTGQADAVVLLGQADVTVRSDAPTRLAVAEALGRAGDASAQVGLASCVVTRTQSQPGEAAACALALGRHGRRKLALAADAQAALVGATTAADPALRHAAVYALAREHDPQPVSIVTSALLARVADTVPEIRATAVAGLAKRKALADASARGAVEGALRDADWRVAVEAVRALMGLDDAGRTTVASELARYWSQLVDGNASAVHPLTEALRAQIGKAITAPESAERIVQLAALAKADTKLTPIARGWVDCLARVAAPAPAAQLVDSISTCGLPDHLRLPLLAELVTSSLGDAATRRAAMRVMLAHDDPRVRAAGLSVIASTWKEADPRGQQTIVTTIIGAIASKNPIVASAAVDATDALYEELAAGSPQRAALDSSLVTRGAAETDVELATQLYTVIGKQTIAGGGDACRAGLTGHPVRVKAAVECLRKLGEAVEMPALGAPPVPPHDVAAVIGHRVTWHLATSRGPIDIELRPDVAPWAVATVVGLTQRHYYDGLELHRVVPNFVAQGGDPTQSGYGGPGFMLPAEPASAADGPGFMQGGVGMADAGPDSAGSQWFVMHSDAPHLDGRYTWIGSVRSGQKSADALVIGDRVKRATVTIE